MVIVSINKDEKQFSPHISPVVSRRSEAVKSLAVAFSGVFRYQVLKLLRVTNELQYEIQVGNL